MSSAVVLVLVLRLLVLVLWLVQARLARIPAGRDHLPRAISAFGLQLPFEQLFVQAAGDAGSRTPRCA